MYLIKRIIRGYITVTKIILQSIIDVIRLLFSPLELTLKLFKKQLNRRKYKRYTDNNYTTVKPSEREAKHHKHDNYQSQIDSINTRIRDITPVTIIRISDNINNLSDRMKTRQMNYEDDVSRNVTKYNKLNNRVSELELSKESTLTIFPGEEHMTTDEHVQHSMAMHERDLGRVKEYDYHSELRAKEEKSNEQDN